MSSRNILNHSLMMLMMFFAAVAVVKGDSIFSINGLGQLSYPVNGQSRGMGGVNLALLSGQRGNLINPAITGTIDTTTVTALFLFEQRKLKDNVTGTSIYSWGPRFFSLVLPLSHGLVVGGGLAPFNNMNFHFSESADAFGEPYTLDVSAEGGTYLGSVSLAKNVGDRLFIGSSVNLIFGSTSEEWKRDFVNPSYADADDLLKTRYYGQMYNIGVALRPHPRLALGGIYGWSGNIETTRERSNASGSVETQKTQTRFPQTYGLGLTYQITSRLTVGSDLYARVWNTYRRDEASVPQHDNTIRLSFGLEVAPSTDKAVTLYKKMPWRIGIYHEPGYYIDSSGDRVRETCFTFGTSTFFKEGRGAIDLAFEIGKRGNIIDNGAEEWVFRQSFSVVGWERWFEKRTY